MALACVAAFGPAAAAGAATTTYTTAGEHAFVVPDGVRRVDVVAVGGQGGGGVLGGPFGATLGGLAGLTTGTLDVTPGQVLYAVVGGNGGEGTAGSNGGGRPAPAGAGGTFGCARTAGGGGGASDVRTLPVTDPGSVDSRVLVAGGGGGGGSFGAVNADDRPKINRGGHQSNGGIGDGHGEGGRVGTPGAGGYAGGAGTVSTGGAGGSGAPGSGAGCGGAGGGGYGGGGAAGPVAPAAAAGGGGGGGGLAPAGGSLRTAQRGTTPSVSFTTPGTPALSQSAPLRITAKVSPRQDGEQYANCTASCSWCGNSLDPGVGVCRGQWDPAFETVQTWGSAGLQQPEYSQSAVGFAPVSVDRPVTPGDLFPLTSIAHFNVPIRGDSPTTLSIKGKVVIHPPAGDEVVFQLLYDRSIALFFLESDNTGTLAGCDPTIQVSALPCDDQFTLVDNVTGLDAPSIHRLHPTLTASGVRWHLDILGFSDGRGGVQPTFATREEHTDERQILARLTVDTNTTSTVLKADDAGALTATVTPVPQTGGTVAFRDGDQPVPGCEAVAAASGHATCTPTAPAPGVHRYTASYSGGVGFAASSAGPVDVTVAAPPTPDPDPGTTPAGPGPGGDPGPAPGGTTTPSSGTTAPEGDAGAGSGTGTGGGGTGATGLSGTGGVAGRPATTRVSLRIVRARLATALRHGLLAEVRGARARTVLRLTARAGGRVVARATARVRADGRVRVRLRFTATARSRYRHARRLTVQVRAAGRTASLTLTRAA